MRKTQHYWLTTSALVGAACLALPGLAVADVAAATSGETTVQEVVITAQKRTEKLSQAPVAASVVSTSALADSDSTDISDLNKLVPSVQLNGSFNGRVPMGMRGVSSVSNEGTVGLSSGVEVLVDGIPIPSDSVAGNALEDVARIEVLKGPQSTLGGRSASSGELSIVTFGPTPTFQGGASATITNDNEQHVIAHVSGPVSDMVEFSLAGWDHHLQYPIKNIQTDKYSYSDTYGLRAKVLVHATSNLDVSLAAHYGDTQSHGSNFVYSYLTPGQDLLFTPGPFSQAAVEPGITASQNNQNYVSPVTNSGTKVNDTDMALTLDYRLGDYTVSSTTSFQHEGQTNIQDLFLNSIYFFNVLCNNCNVFLNTQSQHEKIDQTTEEIKFLSPGDKRLTYVVGAFFSDAKVQLAELRSLPPALENIDVTAETKTYDVYARGTFKFTEDNLITAGIRYNDDNLSYSNFQTGYAQASPLACQQCYSASSNDSNALVGDISLQHKFADSSMAYLTYSHGYAPKAYNTALALTAYAPQAGGAVSGPGGLSYSRADTLVPVGQEKINSFELGVKGSYFDHRVTLDAALFDTLYDNYQIQTFTLVPGVLSPPLLLVAAGRAETSGLEFNSTLRPTDLLSVGFNAAFIKAVFKSYPNAACYTGQTTGCTNGTQNISGDTMPNSPKVKFNLNVTQKIPMNAAPFDLAVRADYTYRSSAQMLTDQNPQSVISGFALVNLSATATTKDGKYALTAFVNNVFNKHYMVDMEDFWSGPWGSNAVIGQPARDSSTFGGVRLEAKF